MLVDGGVISWIGRDHEAVPEPGTRVVDLAAALVTPAFVDAHVHATGTGLALTGLDLAGRDPARRPYDLVERAARTGRGRPVLGGGWDDTGWPEQRPPTAAELDRAGYGGAGLPRPGRRALARSSPRRCSPPCPGCASSPGSGRTACSPATPTTPCAPPRSARSVAARRGPAARDPAAGGVAGHRLRARDGRTRRSRATTTWPACSALRGR